MAINSRAPLDRSPKSNWVEDSGGLPMYIRRIANHLHQEKGMTIGHAIAVAVNAVKKMCATGDLNWHGIQQVNAGSHAEACAAVADWERKKAQARVSKADFSGKWTDDKMIAHLTGEDMSSVIHKGCGCEHDMKKENKRRKKIKKSKKEEECKEGKCDDCIAKRNFSQDKRDKLKEQGKTDAHGGFPLEKPIDVKNAVRAIGRAKNPELEKKRIIAAARKMGCTQYLPQNWSVAKSNLKISKKELKQLDREISEVFKKADPDTDPDTVEFTVSGNIEKSDDEKQLVFGWASIARRADGTVVVDKQGDVLEDIDQMEKVAYDFVLHSRDGGEMHVRKGVSTLVESFVSTPEKCAALGIPEGTLPVGWWVGFKVKDRNVWKGVKEGKYRMFSVHGSGTRKALD